MTATLTQKNRNMQPRRGKSSENAAGRNCGAKSHIAILTFSSDLNGK